MFHRSVSRIPSRESWASFSCSNLARCLCHSSGKRSLVEGFKSSSGRKRREDLSAAPAAERGSSEDAPATLVTVTAAPVAAINSRLVTISVPLLLVETLLCGTLLTHFPSAGKRGMKRWQRGYLLRTEHETAALRDGASRQFVARRQACWLLKWMLMNGRLLFRIVLPAVVALPLGFIGLALAAENEPTIPAPLLMVLSPGLKLAELIAPGQHGSLGATFGWFLRVGIAANAAYYFMIFFLLAYLFTRRSTPAQ